MANYCNIGDMTCDIFFKLNEACQFGTRRGVCPEGSDTTVEVTSLEVSDLLDVEDPASHSNDVETTGEEYVRLLRRDLNNPYYGEMKGE